MKIKLYFLFNIRCKFNVIKKIFKLVFYIFFVKRFLFHNILLNYYNQLINILSVPKKFESEWSFNSPNNVYSPNFSKSKNLITGIVIIYIILKSIFISSISFIVTILASLPSCNNYASHNKMQFFSKNIFFPNKWFCSFNFNISILLVIPLSLFYMLVSIKWIIFS